jgi:hypothetical protein
MKTVAVFPGEAFDRLRRCWDGLAALESVQFRAADDVRDPCSDALIAVNVPLSVAEEATAAGKRTFAFVSAKPMLGALAGEPVQFTRSSFLDPILRGRRLQDSSVPLNCPWVMLVTEPLAAKGDTPVWSRVRFQGEAADLVAYPAPECVESPYLFPHCRSGAFMRLLPLIHFLREVNGGAAWRRPPVRACFMLDDPNLHWGSFGFVRYRRLVASARKHNYHVAFATVPLDAWFVHQPTAKLFRENADRVSLLIHGNDHTREELARPRSAERCLQIAAQALRRTETLEKCCGFGVARVMAAPHGSCHAEMAAAMLRVGFEAACISRGSIMYSNPAEQWPATVGLTPAEFLGGGLPTIPRFALTDKCHTEVILAVFLGQAIILVGHHQDLNDNHRTLETLAGFINDLPGARWTNLEAIARSNYWLSTADDVLRIRTYSRRWDLSVPEGVRHIVIEPAWQRESGRPDRVQVGREGQATPLTLDGDRYSMDAQGSRALWVSHLAERHEDHRTVAAPPVTLWPLVRRLLSEGRDRLQPWLSSRSDARASSGGPSGKGSGVLDRTT